MKDLILACAAALGLCFATAAAAAPGLAEKVYDPYVKNGVSEVEVRAGQLQGGALNGESAAVVELEKGFNDRFSLALVAEFEKHVGEKKKLDSLGVEGVVYLGQIPGTGIDAGAYLEYEQRIHAESGVGEAKLLLAKNVDRFQAVLNLIVIQAFNNLPDERDAAFSYAAAATFEIAPQVRAGVEAFGDLGTRKAFGGRQASYIGPKIMWEAKPDWFPAEIELQGAYLFATGSARDYTNGQARLTLELEKRF